VGAEFSPPSVNSKRSAERYRVVARGASGGVEVQQRVRIANRKGEVYRWHWSWGPLVEWHASVQVRLRVAVSEAVAADLVEAVLEQGSASVRLRAALERALASSEAASATGAA
jgi:hypothetical protein